MLKRRSMETEITIGLNIDGFGKYNISIPIKFFKHMLEAFPSMELVMYP